MSSTALKKTIEEILKELDKAGGDEKKKGSARAQVVYKQEGQLLVVEKKVLSDGIDMISEAVGVPLLDDAAKGRIYTKYIQDLEKHEKWAMKNIDPSKVDILIRHRGSTKFNLVSTGKVTHPYRIFIISKYETMKGKKRDSIRTSLLKEYNKQTDAKREELSDAFSGKVGGKDRQGFGWDLGHGEFGEASSVVGITRAEQAAAKAGVTRKKGKKGKMEVKGLPAKDQPKFAKLFSMYEDTMDLRIDHTQMLDDKGNFKKEYNSVLSLQHQKLNAADAKDLESKARLAFIAEAERLLNSESSHTMKAAIEKVLLSSLTKGLTKQKRIKYIGVKPKAKIKENSKAIASKKRKHKDRLNIIRDTGVSLNIAKSIKKDVNRGKRKVASKGRIGSPMQARNMFNATLSEAVRENMGGAALHNVSGRFADSVHVHQVMPHKGTSGVVQYSYMYNPYKTFEGHETRDPRLLIDQTIREQAAEMALGKFTTQRL